MGFNKFRLLVILRIIILSIIMAIIILLVYNNHLILTSFVFIIFVYQIVSLIRLVEVSNRDLHRFLDSVRHSDFSINFINTNLGSSFTDLRESFSSIITDFKNQRKETEEQHQYLQTILNHIGVGFISFDKDGKIELINPAAQSLLGRNNLIKIKQLNSFNPEFESVLKDMKSNSNYLLNIDNAEELKQLSLNATEFLIKSKKYKLVTLQNITGELERERMANELEIARNIQMRLIPRKFPDIPGYEIGAICNPAKEVGGDYYDFSIPDSDKLGIVIGDVSGKGVPASIYMTLTKGMFQSYAENNVSPKQVLNSLNSSLHKIIEKGVFVTMIYGILDHNTNEFIFCRAGHNPIIYYDSENEIVKKIQPAGTALGLGSPEAFKNILIEEKVRINSGDYFLLYTDGITEAKNSAGEFYGEERLLAVFSKYIHKNPSDLLNEIRIELNKYVNETDQYDDITLIALRKVK